MKKFVSYVKNKDSPHQNFTLQFKHPTPWSFAVRREPLGKYEPIPDFKFSRFILNQDSGGVIKGAGRADIFLGSGPYAELAVGHLKHDGELYILIKKP